MSSITSKSMSPFFTVYSATKYGINGFTESLRFELEGPMARRYAARPGGTAYLAQALFTHSRNETVNCGQFVVMKNFSIVNPRIISLSPHDLRWFTSRTKLNVDPSA